MNMLVEKEKKKITGVPEMRLQYMSRAAYKELNKKDIHEQCGFVLGKGVKFIEVVDVPNVASHKDQFKISFFSKLKVMWMMLRKGYDKYAPFHVHNRGIEMSKNDIDSAKPGSFNFVICQGKVRLYRVEKLRSGIKVATQWEYKTI